MSSTYQVIREIAPQYKRLFDFYNSDEATDADREAVEKRLLEMDGDIEAKCDAIMEHIHAIERHVGNIEAEQKRLAVLRKRDERSMKGLENALLAIMQHGGKETVATDFNKADLRTTTFVLVDETLLPDQWKRTKTETSPDKQAISEALKNGVAIPGASLEKRSYVKIS